ncbi:MAG: hypothetical protein QGG19_21915, partial [Alphaproteobacteria bacterium]|nr:hypothetical protein [Alphaproteobacteria bacterium]MDP7053047.1 hypothetical protein [Alphaproteobacteria bacterium]
RGITIEPKSESETQEDDRQHSTFLQSQLLQIAENQRHGNAVQVLNRRLCIPPSTADYVLLFSNISN